MRTFGEIKKYFEFQLEGDDKVYKIPLASSMPAATILMLRDADKRGEGFEAQLTMLKRYIGEELVNELSVDMADSILKAWGEESTDQGASAGES